jgi:hypothetical protein
VTKFNKNTFIIRTQQLVTSSIDGLVCVSGENVYNSMEAAHVKFKKQLFIKEFKSYLSELDIIVLNEYRTVANVGVIKQSATSDKKFKIEQDIEYLSSYIASHKRRLCDESQEPILDVPSFERSVKDMESKLENSKGFIIFCKLPAACRN